MAIKKTGKEYDVIKLGIKAFKKQLIASGLSKDIVKETVEMQEKFCVLFTEITPAISEIMMQHTNLIRNANDCSTKVISAFLHSLTFVIGSEEEDILSITDKDLH